MKPWFALHLIATTLTPTAFAEDRHREIFQDLGAHTKVTEVEGFLIAAPQPGDLMGATAIAKRAIEAFYNNRFRSRPTEPVLVYLFSSDRPYQQYCQKRWQAPCISTFGFYLGAERRIVLNVGPGVGTLTHELVHPIVRADFPDAPTFIDEGLASLFEGFYLGSGKDIYGTKNWRLPRLKQALLHPTERREVGLRELFALSDEQFRDSKEDLHYAMARYFCLWLQARGWLWGFYQAFRDGYASDKTGEKAFQRVTGKTPEEHNADWLRYLRQL